MDVGNFLCTSKKPHVFPESPVTPIHTFEKLFFALFGLTRPEDLRMTNHVEMWTLEMFKVVFAVYLMVTVIVLINLLIAMMSDTYQRIQVTNGERKLSCLPVSESIMLCPTAARLRH